jgi:hypothetical protein
MPQYLVAVQLPADYDPARAEDDAQRRDISALNEEMKSAGVRVFVGGLRSQTEARSIRVKAQAVVVTDGPYIEAKEYIGGFWVLDVPNMDAAVAWARKAAVACRAPIEVREFR